MSFAIGLKVIKRLVIDQDPMAWHKAKLSPNLFSKYEVATFEWVNAFVKQHHALPNLDTLSAHYPDIIPVEVPDPGTYYLQLLENKFYYNVINAANIKSQEILKENQDAHDMALEVLVQAHRTIKEQKYRARILDVGKDAPYLVTTHYHSVGLIEQAAHFGWPYMDQQGGILPGEVISFVGRPAAGKTYLSLWTAIENWQAKPCNDVLFVSMEMSILPITQRIAAMYTHCPIEQLKKSGFADVMYKKFAESIKVMKTETAKFFVVDGNLAATVEDIYILADILECKIVVIDGAYLLRHHNLRLDRYTRVAENAELIKKKTSDSGAATFASWQFAKTASKKKKEDGDVSLEDIAHSDAIAQTSSIVLGLFQEDGVETLNSRKIRVLKGRNGETGQFSVAWDFISMSFAQIDPLPDGTSIDDIQELNWV